MYLTYAIKYQLRAGERNVEPRKRVDVDNKSDGSQGEGRAETLT